MAACKNSDLNETVEDNESNAEIGDHERLGNTFYSQLVMWISDFIGSHAGSWIGRNVELGVQENYLAE